MKKPPRKEAQLFLREAVPFNAHNQAPRGRVRAPPKVACIVMFALRLIHVNVYNPIGQDVDGDLSQWFCFQCHNPAELILVLFAGSWVCSFGHRQSL